MKEFHPPKWSIYIGIAAFAFMVSLFIVLSVTDFVAKNRAILNRENAKKAEEFKKAGDSLAEEFKERNDSIVVERQQDSIIHRQEKQSLLIQFNQKVKKYEARIAGIDTVSDDQFNGSFSVRQMLSDSAGKVW